MEDFLVFVSSFVLGTDPATLSDEQLSEYTTFRICGKPSSLYATM